jgi:hypothetical protein
MVGYGAGLHFVCTGKIEEAVESDRAVKKAVLCVHVKMDEILH